MILRPYQEVAVARLRAAFRAGHRAPLLVSPTGSGKTLIFCFIAAQASAKGLRTLVLVHRRELVAQTSRALDSYGVDHDVLGGMLLTRVATVQAYVRRMSRWSWRPDLIVVDEAHHATSGSSWGAVLGEYPDARVLGCTATPERLDGTGLGVGAGGYFDALVLGPTVAELVTDGYLSRPVVFAPPGGFDPSGVARRGGDWAVGAIEAAMDRPVITGDAVDHYAKHVGGAPAIAFCASIKHAAHVAERFRAAGYRADSIDGKLDDASRRQRIEDLGAGRLQVLTSCEIVSEGTDIPVVAAAILLRPTLSLGLHLQQVGRALRVYPGKAQAVILDHVGNSLRHGLPDDAREWTLDGRKRKPADADGKYPVRQCEQCYFVHQPAPRCPQCGYLYPVVERVIEEVAGDLCEITRRENPTRKQSQCRTYDDLLAYAKARGYNRPHAWAHFVLSSRRGGRRVASSG